MTQAPKNKKKSPGAKLPPWMPENLRAGDSGKPSKKGRPAGSGKAAPAAKSGKSGPGGKPAKPGKPGAAEAPRRGGKGPSAPAPAHPPRGHKRAPAFHDPMAAREAARYENPIASREAITEWLVDATGPQSLREIAEGLDLLAEDRLEPLSRRLAAMVRDGQLLLNRRGGYAVARKLDLVAGTVIANPDGFGFLKCDDGGEDLFLPPGELRKALHGDRVLASITGVDRRGRREGAIVEVLEHRLTRLTGRYGERARIGIVVPDDRRVLTEVLIPAGENNGAREGQLVVVEITEPPQDGRPPVGRILLVLGDRLTPSLVVQAAIHGHDLPHEFPREALAEAAEVALEVPAAEARRRVDLRKLPLVTIDGEDAKDFDDAVWCEPNAEGFRLVVAIADVSHYVRPGTSLDDEATKRATSVYFPGFVVPMLPETLSNGICSLMPKVERLCFACDMQVDFEGNVTRSEFYEAVMRSHARLTYTQVWKAVGEADTEAGAEAIAQVGSLLPQVQRLHQLYQVLARARSRRGAIEFESSEVRFVLDNSGEVVQAGMLERNDAHKLIEECMIAANVEAAKFVSGKQVPAPYRVHPRPPEAKYADLLEYLSEFGLSLPAWGRVEPRDFTRLLKKVRERPDAALLETVLLRSQSLAVYQTDNHGHFGLALEAYAHFTSPIRRYPDLLLHRAIKHALDAGRDTGYVYTAKDMAALSLHCSEKERKADEVEREVDERYRSAWMEKHVGHEFDGVVSGVTNFGLFVELAGSKVNGLVHVTQLPQDYYHFDPLRRSLAGERTGLRFRLGDPVRVLVLKASVEDRRIDFRLAEPEGSRGGVKKKKKAWAD
ncbi:ribonuclease R [Arenimonas caeni]|uniref:Ribonuclease R n=1 Tax=Arenimonas caeni TaxID=2058085 RepID=A0A2P6MCE2_9GAMM|nr:ribonuclease R [Arenimonas caeni]